MNIVDVLIFALIASVTLCRAFLRIPHSRCFQKSSLTMKYNLFEGFRTKRMATKYSPFTPNPKFENKVGAIAPVFYWDPLDFCKDVDDARFDRLRSVELKHGRISMLAIVGHLVTTAGYRWQGEVAYGIKWEDVPAGLAAVQKIPPEGIFQIMLFIGLLETGYEASKDLVEESCEPYWADNVQKQNIELNNGRAAQMGILGLMMHEKIDNNPYILNSILGSPIEFNAAFKNVAAPIAAAAAPVVEAVAPVVDAVTP
jgi:hypothetical protein